MYIEQLQKFKINLWTYLVIPVLFLSLMVYNYISTKGLDTAAMMKDMIKLIGVNGTFVALVGPLSLMLIVVFFYNKFIQNNTIRILTTSRPKIDWKRVFFSFGLWSLITIITTVVSYYNTPEDFVLNFKPKEFAVFVILAVLFIPLQTSFEEYLFRAHMMQGLGLATKTRWIPLVVTSFLFGIMHIANPEVEKLGMVIMFYYIGTGLFLGILTLMDEGLELALGFHAANNLVGALLITSDWSAFQTHSILKDVSEPNANIQIFIPILVIFPILLCIFAIKYKWSNWKEKLFGTIKPIEAEEFETIGK
ncbi:CPBP family intramembrane glutamic endopeptidase [Flavobacterium facile]|uniref:CPBP family intramembrane glutamic endopeptidase n=1 Tax=Flavobacterium facile TaxID=2893174 RepID=UPI002E765F97|nr:CPBP family intramembrane glutamic endopeptidase [Flavobacterium sp. T-12]